MSRNQNTSDRLTRRQSALERRTLELKKLESNDKAYLATFKNPLTPEDIERKTKTAKADVENLKKHIAGDGLKVKHAAPVVQAQTEPVKKGK